MASWAPGRLDLFERGPDSSLRHKFLEGFWSTWESLGGFLASDPVAVSWGPGRIDVFVRGADDAIWHRFYDNGWSPWESLGGATLSRPAVASWAPGRLDVFIRGTDNQMWHRFFAGAWSAWEPLGGGLASEPAAVSFEPGRIDVFAQGTDTVLYHKFFDDGRWIEWHSHGGVLSAAPAVSSWGPGRLDVFARGSDGLLYHLWFDNAVTSNVWEPLGDAISTAPSAVSWDFFRIDLFAGSSDGTLLHRWFDGRWSAEVQSAPCLPIRGLWVQFDRRGFPNGYRPGQVIQEFNNFDPVVGSTVAAEVALQLDVMRAMGVNTITIELRTADPVFLGGPPVPPTCNIAPVLGFQWPQPTGTELANLAAFFDLVLSKGMRVMLMLNNTHMEEQPPTNSQTWLGAILEVVKNHPALDLIAFGGEAHLIDSDGDGLPDACGIPAEAPLWLGPTAVGATYVKWAIGFGLSLGIPARKLSAEAIIGNFFIDSQPPAGPSATGRHLWSPIGVLKTIFDSLGIPDNQRTYAISFYEHRKCFMAQGLPCTDTDPHTWADQTLQALFATIGTGNGARVVAAEMGAHVPVDPTWPTERAFESLITLMEKWGVSGGSFWRWTSDSNDEDANPQLAQPVKRRGIDFTFNPVQQVILQLYK